MRKYLIAFVVGVVLAGCGIKLPPIEIIVPPATPPVAVNSTPPAPPVEPPPVVEPKPEQPAPPQVRDQDIEVIVRDVRDNHGIAGAECFVDLTRYRAPGGSLAAPLMERQVTDSNGRARFRVVGQSIVGCSAKGYQVVADRDLPPGQHNFDLVPEMPPPAPPKPIEPSAPPAGSVFAECSAANNTLKIARECVEAVARTSMFYKGCQAGSQHDCHYYAREVAIALRTAQNDPRWGIVRKTSGENVDGYSEDVVAYLPEPLSLTEPTWRWRGADLIGGSGAPGARFQWGDLHQAIKCGEAPPGQWCNREDMTWAPVPR